MDADETLINHAAGKIINKHSSKLPNSDNKTPVCLGSLDFVECLIRGLVPHSFSSIFYTYCDDYECYELWAMNDSGLCYVLWDFFGKLIML
jgi:hypothetical protein